MKHNKRPHLHPNFAKFSTAGHCSSALPYFMFPKTYFVSAKANERRQNYNQQSTKKVKLPVEIRVFFKNIIHCTKPCLTIFYTQKMSIIIADSCFKSLEIDFENKIWDLSGYFSTQNSPIEYWAMFETGEKGNIRWFWVANQTENWKRAALSLIFIIIERNTLVENEGCVTGSGTLSRN